MIGNYRQAMMFTNNVSVTAAFMLTGVWDGGGEPKKGVLPTVTILAVQRGVSHVALALPLFRLTATCLLRGSDNLLNT